MSKISVSTLIITFILSLSLACRLTESAAPPPCPVENLMINKSLFPEDWDQQGPPRERAAPVRWGIDKLGVTFISQKNGVALQDVHRGRDVNETENGYFDNVTSWFHSGKEETEWYIPSDFNYESPVANRYRFGCHTHTPSGVQSCQLVGQYGVYLTRFRTHMSPIMTYEDLEHILQTIDNKMAKCLGR